MDPNGDLVGGKAHVLFLELPQNTQLRSFIFFGRNHSFDMGLVQVKQFLPHGLVIGRGMRFWW